LAEVVDDLGGGGLVDLGESEIELAAKVGGVVVRRIGRVGCKRAGMDDAAATHSSGRAPNVISKRPISAKHRIAWNAVYATYCVSVDHGRLHAGQ
jgi:hypothetical protein